MDAKILLGRRVKEYRTKMGLSMEEMAFRCGLHASYFTLLENGRRNPSLDTLEKVAAGLDVSLSELLNFEEEPDVTMYDATTNKIISAVTTLLPEEKEQALVIMNAIKNIAQK